MEIGNYKMPWGIFLWQYRNCKRFIRAENSNRETTLSGKWCRDLRYLIQESVPSPETFSHSLLVLPHEPLLPPCSYLIQRKPNKNQMDDLTPYGRRHSFWGCPVCSFLIPISSCSLFSGSLYFSPNIFCQFLLTLSRKRFWQDGPGIRLWIKYLFNVWYCLRP